MTERMENALNHLKTAIDVDPWAVEVVEKAFKAWETVIDQLDEEIESHSRYETYFTVELYTEVRDMIERTLDDLEE